MKHDGGAENPMTRNKIPNCWNAWLKNPRDEVLHKWRLWHHAVLLTINSKHIQTS